MPDLNENGQITPPDDYNPNVMDTRQLQTIRTLLMVASIAGPVSFIIGGVILSTAGLVCGFIALYKINNLMKRTTSVAKTAEQFRKPCIVALVMCGVALIVNAVFLVMNIMTLMSMIESGEFGKMVADGIGSGTATGTGSGSSSAWG